jgi:Sec-independent protein translocase protein TatA
MDSIFGIGLPEFILIVVIAGMVMGPERIARTARSLGLLTARLQAISRSFFRQLNAELDSADQDGQLRSTYEELNQLRRQVCELRDEVFTLATGTVAETKQTFQEIKRETERSILPPGLTPGAKKQQTPAPQAEASVYHPPALFVDEAQSAPGGQALNGSQTAPARLPRRLEIAEDPDG